MTTRIVMIVALLIPACAWIGAGGGSATPAREVTVGRGPTALVIDRRTERAFVLNSADQTISVLDLRAGTVLRTIRAGLLPGTSLHPDLTNALAVDERRGRVFVGTDTLGRGGLTTLDAITGRILASVSLPLFPRQIAVDQGADRVFVSSAAVAATQRVSVLDAMTGHVLRTVTLDQGVGPLTVDERQGYILASGDRGLSVLDARNGALARTIAVGSVGGIVVSQRRGQAFLATTPATGTSGGSLTVINLTSGAVMRRIAGLYPQDLTIDDGLNRVYATSGEAMGAAPAGRVATIDTASGRLLWSATVGVDPGQVVADASDGTAFVLNGQDGTVSILDARRGVVRRTVRIRAALRGTVVDQEGALSHLIAVDAAANRLLIANPSPFRIPRVSCAGGCPPPLPIVTGRGSLSVLDATTGALRRTFSLGRAPLTMVLDDSTGQVIVLDVGALGTSTVKGSVSILSISP